MNRVRTSNLAKEAVAQTDFVLTIMGGTSFTYQTLNGTAIATLAVATLLSREYPRWLCWAGSVGGAYWGVADFLVFTQVPSVRFWMVMPATLIAAV